MWKWKGSLPKIGDMFIFGNSKYEVREFENGNLDICQKGNNGEVWTMLEVNPETKEIVWRRDKTKKTMDLLKEKAENGKRVMTNYQRIHNMGKKELAEFLFELNNKDMKTFGDWYEYLNEEHRK